MKRSRVSKLFLAPAVCAALLALPSAALAVSISGTIRDNSVTHNGIAGIEVCARPEPYEFEESCTETGAGGTYALGGLPASSYQLHFSSARNRLNYVSEFYDDKLAFPGDVLPVNGDVVGIDAELAVGGAIKGTATDSATSGAAVGAEVCASSFSPVEYSNCAITGADGSYEINALASGDYTVSFFGGSDANYLRRYYDESEMPGGATSVPVTAGAAAVEDIDAVLQPGAQILGTVTEAGTGTPQGGIEVCLYDTLRAPEVGFREPCVLTDPAGHYAIRSLRAGIYDVVFSHDQPLVPNDPFFEQWYDGVASLAQATAITIAPPQMRADVDAALIHYPVDPPRKPETVKVTLIPTTPPTPPPLKCKKGFRRKWVKGTQRCVKIHKKHHRHKGGYGPHAVATGH
jgi:hypothetical protein